LASRTVIDSIKTDAGAVWPAFRPNSLEVYVANGLSNTVSVIDSTTRTVTGVITVGQGAHNVTFAPDGSQAYVAIFADYDGNTVDVIDTVSRTRVASIPVGIAPHEVVISSDGSTAYVANLRSRSVGIIDTVRRTMVDTIATDDFPSGLALTPDGAEL